MVRVPVRAAPVFRFTVTVTVPLPVPLEGLTDKKSELLLVTFQSQPAVVFTDTENDSPATDTSRLVDPRV